jgi:hypothetical protein
MRILNILSGIAVLLTTLAFGHLLHRYFGFTSRGCSRPWFFGTYGCRRGCGHSLLHRRMFAVEKRALIREFLAACPLKRLDGSRSAFKFLTTFEADLVCAPLDRKYAAHLTVTAPKDQS